MLTTRDPAIDRFARAARQHGIVSTEAPIEIAGFNYRMTDVQAAIGRVQLGRLLDMLSERRMQVGIYRDRLQGIVRFPDTPPYARSNWQSLCVRLPDGADPSSVSRTLAAEGIATRFGIANAHQQPIYSEPRVSLPASEEAAARSLMLPLYPGMTREEVERVCVSVAAALRPHTSS
jgi:dTDP-4-amino-4,6-dideoxygalactose transaminase